MSDAEGPQAHGMGQASEFSEDGLATVGAAHGEQRAAGLEALVVTHSMEDLAQMKNASSSIVREALDAQCDHWESTYRQMPNMFGGAASNPAQDAAKVFRQESKTRILELGAGQGRDTFFFAQDGFRIYALDYSVAAVEDIRRKAGHMGLSHSIMPVCHDVRTPLPFEDQSFDGCYSHMLYCMALTTSELERLSNEVSRVLRPEGLSIYTVRHVNDPHYGTGIHRGEDMYEIGGGFIVHFFSEAKVIHLAKGYEMLGLERFEEGKLPKKLFRVTLRKK